MIRICTRILKFSIGVPRVDLTPREIRQHHKVDFFPIVGFKHQKLGACVLNQPANKNILTQQFIDELYRFMLSYQFDHSVQNIWIQSKDSVFSHGVDYKRLTEDKSYLDKLSKLAILFASINKPVFSQISGGAKGVGAYLLSMITMPLGYTNTYMKIDDTMRGLTPLMGGTHRLSRLPLHIGFYLALTGDEFNFEEMTQIGYIKGTICNDVRNSQIRSKLEQANLYFRQKLRYSDFDEQKLEEEQKQLVKNNQNKYKQHLKYSQGEILCQSASNLNLKFAVNQHLAASSDYYNTLNPYNSFSKQRNINNYYKLRLQRPLEYLKKNNLVQVFEIGGVQIPRLDLAKIDYIFSQDSLQKILKSLSQEKSEWAQKAYNKITKSDPLALNLTFQLLKKAEKLPWIACLQNQFTVARRLVQNSRLKLKKYTKSSQFALVNQYSHLSALQVPRQVIQSYLSPGQGQYKLQHKVKSHSLHPYNDYYQTVPDAVRKYLNQQELNDSILHEQVPEVMRFLNNNKINYSSQVFDLAILRKYVYQQLQLEKQKQSIIKRLNFISRNDYFLNQFKNQRQAYLDSISEQNMQTKINEKVKDIFNSKFEQRFKDFQDKTANMIGLQNKLSLFKNIKNIILNNLMYNGAAYQNYQKNNTSYNGPIYFDPQGKDIYSTTNPYITSNPALNQLTKDLSKGLELSEEFLEHENKQMPTFSATPHLPLQERQIKQRSVWELIKFRYDEKPEVWAETYVYKEMVEQAARTSEELGGYLQWTFQNYYDLLNYSEKKKQTYGEFAADIVTQIKTIRNENIQKLKALQEQRKIVNEKNIFSKIYQFKDQEKMRQCFPYYVNESVIPGQFRRTFLSVLDSTLKQFTEMDKIGQRKLLLKEELGVVDRWINKDITTEYTQLLKNDVQYVTSYLQILMIKDMLIVLKEFRVRGKTLEEVLELIRQNYNVDFYFSSNKISLKDVHAKIFSFLYFLMDMHSQAKKNLKSPQSKLIDFINRLKQTHEDSPVSSMPYSFESLMLMIAKDRRRIYDRYIGEQFISEPEFFIEHITRESKKVGEDILRRKDYDSQIAKRTFKEYVDKHSDAHQLQRKSLIQNYFYYMMLFEKHIHEICGKDHFIPTGFINQQHVQYNAYCQQLFRPKSLEQWLNDELNVVIEQLLNERLQAERKLSKGELYVYDQSFNERFKVGNIKLLIRKKIEEEIYLLKNMFGEQRQYDFEATEEEISDQSYTTLKRTIKNTDALKKLNNLALTEEISLEYMSKAEQTQNMTSAEKLFARNQKQYLKNGMASRLPSKSYQRMARDLYAYPEEINPVQTSQETELFKRTHITFSKSAGQKIVLSNFTSEYKALSDKMKDEILDEMVSKIRAVQTL